MNLHVVATTRREWLTDGGWWRLAACRSADPDLFFPVSAAGPALEQAMAAKAICAGCPVRRECLTYATITRQQHGIWGGMTEEERHAAFRRPHIVRTPATVTQFPSAADINMEGM